MGAIRWMLWGGRFEIRMRIKGIPISKFVIHQWDGCEWNHVGWCVPDDVLPFQETKYPKEHRLRPKLCKMILSFSSARGEWTVKTYKGRGWCHLSGDAKYSTCACEFVCAVHMKCLRRCDKWRSIADSGLECCVRFTFEFVTNEYVGEMMV